jgi:multiple sugar transport system permease protein
MKINQPHQRRLEESTMTVPPTIRTLSAKALRERRTNIALYAIGIGLALAFLFPLIWSLLTSLKPSAEALASPPTFLPSQLSLENYARLAQYGDGLVRYLGNSVLVALITVIGTVILSVLAGYGFSKFHFWGKNTIFVLMLTALMIPFQSILTPLFLLLGWIGLRNSLLGLALVYITFQLPFSVFMMRNSFDSVPKELEEAALIDGCTATTLLVRVMLPVVSPGAITVALFAFFASWNEFLGALIFMTDSSQYTLPVMLLNAQSGQMGVVNWGAMQAGLTLTMLPCAILFLLLQRYYVSGLIAGSTKG